MDAPELREFTRRVTDLIVGDDLPEAIDQLKSLLFERSKTLYDEVILLESRSNRLRRDWRKGIIAREPFEAERAKLSAALLDLLEEIPRKLKRQELPLAPESAMAAGLPAVAEAVAYEQILGINNLKQISWIGQGVLAAQASAASSRRAASAPASSSLRAC